MAGTRPPVRLAEFAKSRPTRKGPPSWWDGLPQEIKDEIEAARRATPPVPYAVIAAWLRESGHPEASYSKLQHRFLNK